MVLSSQKFFFIRSQDFLGLPFLNYYAPSHAMTGLMEATIQRVSAIAKLWRKGCQKVASSARKKGTVLCDAMTHSNSTAIISKETKCGI